MLNGSVFVRSLRIRKALIKFALPCYGSADVIIVVLPFLYPPEFIVNDYPSGCGEHVECAVMRLHHVGEITGPAALQAVGLGVEEAAAPHCLRNTVGAAFRVEFHHVLGIEILYDPCNLQRGIWVIPWGISIFQRELHP